MTERVCPIHRVPLLELRCAYEHDCLAWIVVQDGEALAFCTEERIVWKKSPPVLCRRIAGRDDGGFGGRPWGEESRRYRVQMESQRRKRERVRCAKLGISVPEWAKRRHGPNWGEREDSFVRSLKYKAFQITSEEAEA